MSKRRQDLIMLICFSKVIQQERGRKVRKGSEKKLKEQLKLKDKYVSN